MKKKYIVIDDSENIYTSKGKQVFITFFDSLSEAHHFWSQNMPGRILVKRIDTQVVEKEVQK